eukprot:COSAG04_NODE_469_length_13856_cov_8.973832_3_plen_272_part_00
MRETLPPGPRRKPFSLTKANPFAVLDLQAHCIFSGPCKVSQKPLAQNVLLLFRNGRGLASLATACSAYFLCQSNWSIAASYRMGVLGWTPAHSSYFNTVSSLFSSLSAGKLVLPFMKRAGNRMAFQQGCLIATMAYVGCGLSWVGSGRVRTALQYGLSVALLQAWPAACLHSVRAMIVKQGIEVTSAGKGELNAAISGLGSLSGIIGPGLLWGPLFKRCSAGNGGVLGKGGHYFGCCAFMLAASVILRTTPSSALFLEEARAKGGGAGAAE